MSKADIIRAWRDAEYRSTISDLEQAQLPVNPAGPMTLSESDLGLVSGSGLTFGPICLSSFAGNCTSIGNCRLTWSGLSCPDPAPRTL